MEIRATFNNQIEPKRMAVIRELVRRALDAMVTVGFLVSGSVDENDLVRVVRAN